MSCRPSRKSARGSRTALRRAELDGVRRSASRTSAQSSRAEFERVAWEAKGAAPRDDDPARGRVGRRATWPRCSPGTPLAGDERALELLKDLRHGGLYQRMDEVGRQRLAAVMVRTIARAGRAARRR